jgi:hypothetical protein
LFLALSVPLLAGNLSPVERYTGIGLVTVHAVAFFTVWTFAVERGGEESTTGPCALSEDVTFGVLKNRRRREALRYLRGTEGTVSLRDLAEHVAAEENDVWTHELTSDQRKRVYTTLYQCHLPRMDDAGILEYERNRGRVELLDAASELFEHIDDTADANAERRWGLVSLGFSFDVSVFAVTGLLIAPPSGTAWLRSWAALGLYSLLVGVLVKSCRNASRTIIRGSRYECLGRRPRGR